VRSLADEGMSILLVEHRVEDVLKIQPDRVLYMKEGRIHFSGPPEDLDEHVNYHEVKLPAPLIIEHAAHTPPQSFPHPPAHIELAEPEPTLVRFDGVTFSYQDNVNVLEDINLEIRKKDVIAVLGANGAGKTTLVKHAIGLLKPKNGSVHLTPKENKSTTDLSVAQIADVLGYVFQSPSHMLFAPTVREELSFGPKNLGHSADDTQQQVERAIEIVNLKGFEDEPPLALSFGQQKRVSIAAILSMRSQIMVMDEPTAGQDYQNYLNFMDSIIQLPFEAILFITHDVDMAVIYANRVLLMNDGRIAADGSPYDVLKDFELLQRCRIMPTSLLKANLERYEHTRQFLRAEELAHIAPI
jgi:energy-coupling factor transport system ATP-binding protein